MLLRVQSGAYIATGKTGFKKEIPRINPRITFGLNTKIPPRNRRGKCVIEN